MSSRLGSAYAAAMCLLAVAYFALPRWTLCTWTAMGLVSALAVVVGVRRHRPERVTAWHLFFGGVLTFAAGDAVSRILTELLGPGDRYPTLADGLSLATYPLLAAGLLLVVRTRSSSDRGALLDALIVSIGLALLSWVLLITSYVADDGLDTVEKVVAVAYPIGDVLILAVLVRVLTGGVGRSWSLWMLTTGTAALFVTDVVYALARLDGGLDGDARYLDIGWILFYAAWGGAALAPDMTTVDAPAPARDDQVSRRRLLLLTLVTLVAPGTLLVQAVRGSGADVVLCAGASVLLFVLVTARLDVLVRYADGLTGRERVFRRAGERLVAAATTAQIQVAASEAMRELTEGYPDLRTALVVMGDDGTMSLPRGADLPDDSVAPGLATLVSRHVDVLTTQRVVLTDAGDARPGPSVGRSRPTPVLIVAYLEDERLRGLLVVVGPDAHRPSVRDGLTALAMQVSLAVESVALTESESQRRNEAHFRSLIQHASDVILVVGEDLAIGYQTPSVTSVLGYPLDDLVGRPVTSLLHPVDAAHAAVLLTPDRGRTPASVVDSGMDWRVWNAQGQLRHVEVVCRDLLEDPSVNGFVLTLRDVTERRALEEQLTHRAFHDSLTGLANRALFLDRVEHAVRRLRRHEEGVAVLLVDLDDFKVVNDTRGHEAGDELLISVGERLRGCVREADTVARLGGDEFAVFVEGISSEDEVRVVAATLGDALRTPHRVGDDEIIVRASIGIAVTDDVAEASELLRHADLAMYAAKDSGKGTYEVYRPALQDRMLQRLEQRRDLELGLLRSEFALHYQPIVDMTTGRMSGVEALLRWQHPRLGLVSPTDFIDLVEESDLAVPLGAWVLSEALGQAAAWHGAHRRHPPLRMSVNIAPRQLRDPGFVAVVRRALAESGTPPASLAFEITERTLTGDDPTVTEALTELRDLGVTFAIDDFGTGYSALGYLRRFPISVLKIDRSFVGDVDQNADDAALVNAIVRMGETFGLQLVAEGVETQRQRQVLLELGCTHGQGFLFWEPLTPDQVSTLLAEQYRAPVPTQREAVLASVPGEDTAV